MYTYYTKLHILIYLILWIIGLSCNFCIFGSPVFRHITLYSCHIYAILYFRLLYVYMSYTTRNENNYASLLLVNFYKNSPNVCIRNKKNQRTTKYLDLWPLVILFYYENVFDVCFVYNPKVYFSQCFDNGFSKPLCFKSRQRLKLEKGK